MLIQRFILSVLLIGVASAQAQSRSLTGNPTQVVERNIVTLSAPSLAHSSVAIRDSEINWDRVYKLETVFNEMGLCMADVLEDVLRDAETDNDGMVSTSELGAYLESAGVSFWVRQKIYKDLGLPYSGLPIDALVAACKKLTDDRLGGATH